MSHVQSRCAGYAANRGGGAIGELSDIQVADRIVRLNRELEGRITVMFYPKTSEKLYMMFKCLLDLIVWIEVIEAE